MEAKKNAAGQGGPAPETEKKKFTLKGSVPALSHKKLITAFTAVGAALFVLRVYQLVFLIDPETGFFTNRSNPTVWLFYILAIGLMAAAPLCFYLAGDGSYSVLPARKDPLHGVALLLVAVAAGWDSYQQFLAWRGDPGTPETAVVGRVALAYGVFAAISAVALLWEAIRFFTGRGGVKAGRYLLLAPPLWMFFRTVSFFAITANYLFSTQLLLNIFGSAFLMLFFFHYARKTSDVDAAGNTGVFCAVGLVAAAFLFSAAVPALLLKLLRTADGLYCEFTPYMLAGGLFCVTALLQMKKRPEKTVATAPFSAESPADEA